MFNRRTLAAFTAVAALAGGASGAVTSTVTTPEGANAAEPPKVNINPGTTPDDKLGPKPATKRITDSMKISAIWGGVDKLEKAQARMDARLAALDARSTALDARAAETQETIEALSRMTARGTSGRSLVNLVDDILAKTRLICADVVGEVVPIAPDRHVAACD